MDILDEVYSNVVSAAAAVPSVVRHYPPPLPPAPPASVTTSPPSTTTLSSNPLTRWLWFHMEGLLNSASFTCITFLPVFPTEAELDISII